MSKNLYEATILQLKGRALEAYAALDLLLKNPTGIPDHSNWVDEIVRHAKTLAENENAIVKLQQYFGKQLQSPAPQSKKMSTSENPEKKEQLKQIMAETLKKRQKELYPVVEADASPQMVIPATPKKKSKKTKRDV
mgnify:FL=1|tara:strand:- start:261 stop:668 length:408 start_codon:yes stop_codon:yes gene_type:complete